ncbi:MAG TPA: zinc-binding dehydrogenase [Candidatus Limnocylindria bacterium]|nr:zinc-binding dehydrogenase [Candidatus Limnocylindria bacterium]
MSSPVGGTNVRAAVLTAPGQIEIRELPVPAVAPDSAILSVELCGICGTDLKYFSGKLPAPYPLILGHEVVGRIAAIGAVAAQRWGIAKGDRVLVESSIPCWACAACRSGNYRLCPTKGGYGTRLPITSAPGLWGGMAELMYIAAASIIHCVPDAIAPRSAIGIPLLANGFQWLVRKGGIVPGDRVLIQGPGPQGLAAAMIARTIGAREITVTGLASDAGRLAFAEKVGARAVVIRPQDTPAATAERVGGGYDVVLDVSGNPKAIAAAPGHLRPQGTFVLAGLAGRDTSVPIFTDELAWKEIRIQGVLSKDDAAMRSALAIAQSDARIASELATLVTHVFPLADASAAITAAGAGLGGFVKAAVMPRLA